MKTLLWTLLFTISLVSYAQETLDINNEENQWLSFIYQQPGYQLEDPKGDILLLWSAHQIPKFVLNNLKGEQGEYLKIRTQKIEELLQKYPQYKPADESKNIIIDDYLTHNPNHEPIELEGHKAPFKVKNMALMMKQVITEEYKNGIEPQAGTIHEWSPEIKKELHKKFKLFSRLSKVLVALSRGSTSFYMVTGKEEELKDYILSRPMNSINLEEMFRASYRINQGDVYLSLLTVENILSRFWLKPQRSKRALTTRLKDITNYNYRTDKFGAWYHLFGVMFYGYVEGAFSAKMVGNIESLGSSIMGRFQDERQESIINSRGGPVGGELRKFIKARAFETFEQNSKYLEEDFYMDLDEDFTKRIEKKKPKAS